MLTPSGHEAAALRRDLRAECGARLGESARDPGRVVLVGESRMCELELEWDRLESVAGEVDEEEQAEVVAELAIDAPRS